MKFLRNENGIALVTSLLFTLICLGIVMALLMVVVQGTRMSAASRTYRNTTEASYGAVDYLTKDLIPTILTGKLDSAYQNAMTTALSMNALTPCFNQKITSPTSQWSSCTGSPTTPAATQSPDLTFNLKATNDTAGYQVFAKIVDTRCGGDPTASQPCSNSDASGIDYLDAGGGVASATGTVTPQHRPAYYRIEVEAQRAVNAEQKAQLSVLYAY